MPFIRGRYYINPVVGEALEAARELEEQLAAISSGDQDDANTDNDEWAPDAAQSGSGQKGPIHRVEIETASVVPAHSGQATHGFVAHVHRATCVPGSSAASAERGRAVAAAQPSKPALQKPETHVFANDGDLVDFLQRELAKDAARGDSNRGL
jgi:hypothetical protein